MHERCGRSVRRSTTENLLYVRSPEAMKRLALSYDSLLADLYWIRAVQHYGGTRLSTDPNKRYDLLYPLLDLTTSLDDRFNIAYYYGSTFLAEPPPGGPGRPDLAIALLEKGLRAQPDKWEFAQWIGFVHYWWRQDYQQAAAWFSRAAEFPGRADLDGAAGCIDVDRRGQPAGFAVMWQRSPGPLKTSGFATRRGAACSSSTRWISSTSLQAVVARFQQQRGVTAGRLGRTPRRRLLEGHAGRSDRDAI